MATFSRVVNPIDPRRYRFVYSHLLQTYRRPLPSGSIQVPNLIMIKMPSENIDEDELSLLVEEYSVLCNEAEFHMKHLYRTFYLSVILLAALLQISIDPLLNEEFVTLSFISSISTIVFIILTGWMYNFVISWGVVNDRIESIQNEIHEEHPNTYRSITNDKIRGESPSGAIVRGWIKVPVFDITKKLDEFTSPQYNIVHIYAVPVVILWLLIFIYSLLNYAV